MEEMSDRGIPVSFECGGSGGWALWIIVSATKFFLFGLDKMSSRKGQGQL